MSYVDGCSNKSSNLLYITRLEMSANKDQIWIDRLSRADDLYILSRSWKYIFFLMQQCKPERFSIIYKSFTSINTLTQQYLVRLYTIARREQIQCK